MRYFEVLKSPWPKLITLPLDLLIATKWQFDRRFAPGLMLKVGHIASLLSTQHIRDRIWLFSAA